MPEPAGKLQGKLLASYDGEHGRKCFRRLSRPPSRGPWHGSCDAHGGASGDEIGDEILHVRGQMCIRDSNTAELAKLNERLSQRDARIAELERLLSDSRRSGKRQAAPFSKGDPKEEPARPGRRRCV